MAQGERPGRHSRHPSRIITRTNSARDEPQRPAKPKDDPTIRFIKLTLCAKSTAGPKNDKREESNDEKPLEELLPPLTSSNEIDVQLYAIIAVILNQFVQSWYNRITPDSDFVSEIVQIIAHCTRGTEERLRQVDLLDLLFDELPGLLSAHLSAAKTARNAVHVQQQRLDADIRLKTVYHALRPHHALSPPPIDVATTLAQKENESDWCQLLVSDIVRLLLPPEDLLNPCLDALVTEIFSEMIVHSAILGKASEPWMLWEGIAKSIYAIRPDLRLPKEPVSASPANRLEQFGLLSSAEAVMRKQSGERRGNLDFAVSAFWMATHLTILAWNLIRAFVIALMSAASLPQRPPRNVMDPVVEEKVHRAAGGSVADPAAPAAVEQRPVISMNIWTCVGQLTNLQERMPWLTGCLSLLQWLAVRGPGQVCRTNSSLDRLIASYIHDRLLDPALLPPLLQATRNAIFPDNAMAPGRVPPTSDEVLQIKCECARTIVEIVPEAVRTRYFATNDKAVMRRDVEEQLEVLGDPYVNKHLIVAAVELIVVRLFPELADPSSVV